MWPFTSNPAPPTPPTFTTPAPPDQCPVDHTTRAAWLSSQSSSPTSTPHPFHPSSPTASTSAPALPNSRVTSSIPRGASSDTPAADAEEKWVYPSEQQFFNAMLRKKHSPKAEDMKTIVPIHNAVNERAWSELLKWERGMGGERCGGVKLVSFIGKPKERTPKAWLKMALGYTPPFDRHDWLVDRCGTRVRYVIDFYTGRQDPENKNAMAFYLDVRPAVDSWQGVKTRLAGLWGN
ncbi:cytochrome c heme-lyase, partial [Tremellales sp. Uapishka_1]